MDAATHTRRAHSFNAAAGAYAAYRPSYPDALFDAVEDLAGHPLDGARVIDVGAGTGIASARLAARGAHVLGVEPGAGMAAQYRIDHPGLPVVRGDGNALPLRDACADFVTYAQSWHWTEPERALPEALRVLRPGGALAAWWNIADPEVEWVAAQGARLREWFGPGAQAHGAPGAPRPHEPQRTSERATEPAPDPRYASPRSRALAEETESVSRTVRWSRSVPLDHHLANLASHSILLIRDASTRNAFLAAERAALLATFPDATIEEKYIVELTLTRRPTD
ncbi:class I SAM-dependent methyltransferase [Streptomyces sp. NRRL F-5630]|uniref:class I SAM-dependent methyltransferase n=1 Tax=Streptomyces sp. NRRL F-5630 TaxID=1463864 RepID=UPI0004CC6A17|nr:class I SAM-dependent methyltransferase [Streptomyces sp. NRRL F-5630]